MRIFRRGLLVVMLAGSFFPRPSFAADQTWVAQGPGQVTMTGNIKCSFPIAMAYKTSGTTFFLTENDGLGTPTNSSTVDAQVACSQSVFGFDVASNAVPRLASSCVDLPQLGKGSVILWEPWTTSGTGTALNPYVLKQTVTSCSGATFTDRITFVAATPGQTFSYTHDLLTGTTVTIHVTATLTRVQ